MSIPVYILRRVMVAVPTILVVSMLGFTLMRYDFTIGPINIPTGGGQSIHVLDEYRLKNPINPLAALQNNPQISPAAYQAEVRRLGLDKPFYQQYWLWLTNFLQFHQEAL